MIEKRGGIQQTRSYGATCRVPMSSVPSRRVHTAALGLRHCTASTITSHNELFRRLLWNLRMHCPHHRRSSWRHCDNVDKILPRPIQLQRYSYDLIVSLSCPPPLRNRNSRSADRRRRAESRLRMIRQSPRRRRIRAPLVGVWKGGVWLRKPRFAFEPRAER